MDRSLDRPPDLLIGTGDVAEMCGVSTQTVRRWVKRGLIPYYVLPGGLMFKFSDVEQFLAARYVAA